MYVKQFENFLVNHFISNVGDALSAGYKYQFTSPNLDNSIKLWRAFVHKDLIGGVINSGDATLAYVNCNNVKLIPVIHSDNKGTVGFTENFISFLRDKVSEQSGDFKGTALLIIHNSLLDTIINSSTDITLPDQVFNPLVIKTSLGELIDQKDSDHGKMISQVLLEYQFELIDEDHGSMFGFESLYQAISDGNIKFNEIGLINDPDVLTWKEDPEQLKRRLNENRQLVQEIKSAIEIYPDQLYDNLPHLGKKFIDDNFSDLQNWDTKFTYNDIRNEQRNNREQLLELKNETSSRAHLVVRTKAETKAAQKERHILLVVDDGVDVFDLSLDFYGGKISTSELSLSDPNRALTLANNLKMSGGSINTNILISGEVTASPIFFMLELRRSKTSEKYKFKCLVLQKGRFNTSAIENNFVVNVAKQFVVLQTQETSLQIGVIESNSTTQVTEINQSFSALQHGVLDFENLSNVVDRIRFIVESGESKLTFEVEGASSTDSLSLPLLFDNPSTLKLFSDELIGIYNREKNKVYIQNNEVNCSPRSLDLLKIEAELIDSKTLHGSYHNVDGAVEFLNATSIADLFAISPELAKGYDRLFAYYKEAKTLPSLSGWGPGYQTLVECVITAYYEFLSSIPIRSYLTADQKAILNLGFVKVPGKNGELVEAISPLHPLVLSYYNHLSKKACLDASNSFLDLPKVTLKRLNPQGLLPFIYNENHEFSYVIADPENSFWLQCVPQQDSNYSYITKLVRDKIKEFSETFSLLFSQGSKDGARPTFIINSINNGVNFELFMGIVEHITRMLTRTFNIHVNIYDDEFSLCEFDKFSEIASYDSIKREYMLNKGKAKDNADTIVDLLRTRLTYSKFVNSKVEEQAYAHISFFKNNQKVKVVSVDPIERLSGIACDGLINGEASASEQGNYLTGFGLKDVDYEKVLPLKLALLIGRMLRPAKESVAEYRENSAISLAIDDSFKKLLDKSYVSSIWTTIIDPKVTLDFFEASKDMLLIHFSDQYTSSASYDAITVTRQTDLYDRVLTRGDAGAGLVSEFNAFNGEWLLKMITEGEKDRKEKKGTIAAYKLLNCLLIKSDITWVPMSAAEMIRVSGNIGLKMSESEFSRHLNGYRQGAISDDVLFVGFKGQQMFLLPLEVKTGSRPDYKKAFEQAKELKRYLVDDLLCGSTLAHNLYRSLFIRQVLMQIDKYQLYSMYPQGYFDNFLSTKEWWLQGDYELADIVGYPKGVVIANLQDVSCFETNAEEIDGILKMEIPYSYLSNIVSTQLKTLIESEHLNAIGAIPSKYLLGETVSVKLEAKGSETQLKKALSYAEAVHVAVNVHNGESMPSVAPFPSEIHDEEVGENLKVLIGHEVKHNEPVFWEPTNTAKFMNTNSGIIGTMGTGKTQSTKSVVTQLYRNQKNNVGGYPIGMLIFDYKSDYVDDKFIAATNAKKFKLYKLPYNPLSLFGDTPMLPIHTAAGFSETMATAYGLGKKQQLILENIIIECYTKAGIAPEDPSTWTRPAPTIEDVWQSYLESEPDEDSLYAALSKLARFKIFADNSDTLFSLYELVDGIVVVELAGYPPQVQNLVVALTLDLFYSQMQKKGKPTVEGDFRQVTKLLLVDEADNFMSQNFPSLRKILKEGREYGVGVILSTQDITHFKTKENDYSFYILSWVVHRVSQIKNQDIQSIFNIDDKGEQEYLMKTIRELDKHFSLYVDGNKKVQKIKDLAFWELVK